MGPWEREHRRRGRTDLFLHILIFGLVVALCVGLAVVLPALEPEVLRPRS